MNAHDVYDHSIESLREASRRVPTSLPVDIAWPDDLVGKVSDDLSDSFDTVKHAVVPAAAVAVGAGTQAASSASHVLRRHSVLAAVGLGAVVVLVVWMARRSRAASDDVSTADVSLAA